jgi:nucleoside-diphosphate-sugar epimerase
VRVFVTGGSGKIGLPLVKQLVGDGERVLALARSDASARVLADVGAEPVRGSLEEVDSMRAACAEADTVVHLAGGVRGPGRVTPDVLNRQGTENLLAAGADQLVYVSSCAVYGDRSNLWVEEDFEPSPNTRYGRSKADAEVLVKDSGRQAAIVRMAAVYGPGFPILMTDRMREGKAWLPGEGRNYVPIVHIDDAVAGLRHIIGRAGVWHLAAPDQPTTGVFYKAVHDALGEGRPLRFWSTWLPSYLQLAAARNNERLQSRIGQRPRFTPDALKLFTASVRLRVQRLEDSGFRWRWPEHADGIRAAVQG